MTRKVLRHLTFPKHWVMTLNGCGHVVTVERAPNSAAPLSVDCLRCDERDATRKRKDAKREQTRRNRAARLGVDAKTLSWRQEDVYRAQKKRAKVGAMVRIKGQTRQIVSVDSRIDGGVTLDRPVQGFRNWNIEDLDVIG